VTSTPTLSLISTTTNATTNFVYNDDFRPMGAFNGTVVLFDAEYASIPSYGCVDSDYDGFVPQSVALVARGNCTFQARPTLRPSIVLQR